MSFTLSSAQRWWARELPDHTAVSIDGNRLRFADLYAWQIGIAGKLRADGHAKGGRIGVIAANSLEYCALVLALIEAGLVCVPLNFRSTASEVTDVMGGAGVSAIYADELRIAIAAEAGARLNVPVVALESLNAVPRATSLPLRDSAAPENVVAIISTSGSTARPKGVILTQANVIAYACEFALTEPGCARGGSVLCIPPLSSASGYLMLVQYNAMGSAVFMESQFHPRTCLKRLIEDRITAFQGVPTFFEQIAALPEFADADLSQLKFAQVGGARVSPQLIAAWRTKGVTLRNLFGQTEAGGGWAARDDVALVDPIKCGRGGVFTDFVVLDGEEIAAPGVPGEIGIRGPCVSPGYWNAQEATTAAFRDGWLRTGDLGVMDETGNLTFIDRMKDIIISGGLNISAAEVEATIAEMPGVLEVAVMPTHDDKFGETPLAVVHGAPGLSADNIVAHCNALLSNYKVPRYVALETEPLPRLSNGKLDKVSLRRQFGEGWKTLPRMR